MRIFCEEFLNQKKKKEKRKTEKKRKRKLWLQRRSHLSKVFLIKNK